MFIQIQSCSMIEGGGKQARIKKQKPRKLVKYFFRALALNEAKKKTELSQRAHLTYFENDQPQTVAFFWLTCKKRHA